MLTFWGGIAGFFQTIWFIVTYRDPAPSVCNESNNQCLD